MGTFRLEAGAVVSQSGIDSSSIDLFQSIGAPVSNADILTIINHFPILTPDPLSASNWFFGSVLNKPISGSLLVTPNRDGWYLDGSAVATIEGDLPGGFTIDSAWVAVDVSVAAGWFGDDWKAKGAGLTGLSFVSILDVPDTPPITKDFLLGILFGIQWDAFTNNFLGGSIQIFGNYSILSFSWSFGDSREFVRTNSLVQIDSTGDPETGPDLTEVTEITLSNGVSDIVIPASQFIEQTATILIFSWPGGFDPEDEITVTPTIVGTIFSGSILMGTLTVVLANSSGIYKLISDQTHDILYMDSGTIPNTENVKIPNPYFRTGPIGD